MSDTPKDPGAGSGEHPEYRDPTSPAWDEGERSDDTQQLSSGPSEPSGEPLEPPSGAHSAPSPYGQPGPAGQPGPYGQPPNPYAQQAPNPYAAGGAPGAYPTSRPGPPPAPGAPGTLGAGFPPGPPAAYGGPGYGPPAPGQPGPGYPPSPYGRPQGGTTNTSAIVLLVVSGLSTLIGCFLAIPALILGIMAVVKQGESPADSAKFTRWGWIAWGVAAALAVVGIIIGIAIFASNVDTTTGY